MSTTGYRDIYIYRELHNIPVFPRCCCEGSRNSDRCDGTSSLSLRLDPERRRRARKTSSHIRRSRHTVHVASTCRFCSSSCNSIWIGKCSLATFLRYTTSSQHARRPPTSARTRMPSPCLLLKRKTRKTAISAAK